MSTLAERLRELRGTSSQKEMADAVGIKWNAWARYERGEVTPGSDILAKICRVHAVSADWLLDLPTAKPTKPPNIISPEVLEATDAIIENATQLLASVKNLRKQL